jgi:hypothetical protein
LLDPLHVSRENATLFGTSVQPEENEPEYTPPVTVADRDGDAPNVPESVSDALPVIVDEDEHLEDDDMAPPPPPAPAQEAPPAEAAQDDGAETWPTEPTEPLLAPVPGICRICGCTEATRCAFIVSASVAEKHGFPMTSPNVDDSWREVSCTWANADRDLCTRCFNGC